MHSFKRQRDALEKSKYQIITIVKTENENETDVSYRVSYRLTLIGESHLIGETLIMPSAEDIVFCVI